MGRFVKIFDNIEEWQHFKRNNFLQVWILLLMNANYKESYDSYGRKIHVGQVVLSQIQFAERCGITRPTLSNILKSLEKSGEITMETKRNYTLVTILKYKNYQQDKFGKQMTNERDKKLLWTVGLN
jgi:DNA-binding MarR family transcriptional regulator